MSWGIFLSSLIHPIPMYLVFSIHRSRQTTSLFFAHYHMPSHDTLVPMGMLKRCKRYNFLPYRSSLFFESSSDHPIPMFRYWVTLQPSLQTRLLCSGRCHKPSRLPCAQREVSSESKVSTLYPLPMFHCCCLPQIQHTPQTLTTFPFRHRTPLHGQFVAKEWLIAPI